MVLDYFGIEERGGVNYDCELDRVEEKNPKHFKTCYTTYSKKMDENYVL